MNVLPERFTDRVDRVNTLQAEIVEIGNSMLQKAIAAGHILIELRSETPHGQWMPFCTEHIRIKRTQIANYMKAAANESRLPEYQSKLPPGGNSEGLKGFLRFLSEPAHRPEPECYAPPQLSPSEEQSSTPEADEITIGKECQQFVKRLSLTATFGSLMTDSHEDFKLSDEVREHDSEFIDRLGNLDEQASFDVWMLVMFGICPSGKASAA